MKPYGRTSQRRKTFLWKSTIFNHIFRILLENSSESTMRRSEGDLQRRPCSRSPQGSRARTRDRRDDRDRSRSDGPRRADNPGTDISPLRHTGTSPLSPGPLVPWAMTQTNPSRTSPIGGLGGCLAASGPRLCPVEGLGGKLVSSDLVSPRLVALSSRQHGCGPSALPFVGPPGTPDGRQESRWYPPTQGEVQGVARVISDRGPQVLHVLSVANIRPRPSNSLGRYPPLLSLHQAYTQWLNRVLKY